MLHGLMLSPAACVVKRMFKDLRRPPYLRFGHSILWWLGRVSLDSLFISCSMTRAGKLGDDQSYHDQNAEADTEIQKEPWIFLEKYTCKLLGLGIRRRTALPIVIRWPLHVVSVTNAHNQQR